MAISYSLYRVRPGDTLSRIAQAQCGGASHWPELATANGLKSPYTILVGMELRIPRASSVVSNMPGPPTLFPARPANPARMAPGLQLNLSGGDTPARTCAFPTLVYPLNQEFEVLTPAGRIKLTITGSLTIQRSGSFTWEVSKEGIKAQAKAGGLSATMDGKPFAASDPTSAKIRAEYGNKLASIFGNAKLVPNSVTGKAELSFDIGWKFGDSQYSFKPPNTHVYSYAPQPVKADGLEGSIGITVEFSPSDQMRSAPVPIRIPANQFAFDLPTIRARDIRPTPATTVTFGMALLILAMVAMAAAAI